MTFIHWALIALEVVVGTLFTTMGMFSGAWEAAAASNSGTDPKANPIPTKTVVAFTKTVVAFTAPWPILITVVLGWIGPQPHGSFWLTVIAGISATIVGWYLVMLGLAYKEQAKEAGILALIGVLLPACVVTLVYNFSWLFPYFRFPAIDLY